MGPERTLFYTRCSCGVDVFQMICHNTIEMSPDFDFTMLWKKPEFSFTASLVAKGDEHRGCFDEIAEGSGMGVRGKGQSPFFCSA